MKNIIFNLCDKNIRNHFEVLELVNEKSSWNLLYQRNISRCKAMNKVAWNIFFPDCKKIFTLRFLLDIPWNFLVLLRIAVERYHVFKKNNTIRSNIERINLKLLLHKGQFLDSNEFMTFICNF